MAAQPPPPSRTGSAGPPSAGGMGTPQASTPGGAQSQNLNQIVLEYLSKKGYSRTEATLRKESATVPSDGGPPMTFTERFKGRQWEEGYKMVRAWTRNLLDIYKPELSRLLWPLFVHCFLEAVVECYSTEARSFFSTFKAPFEDEHADDLHALSAISEPEHVQHNDIAQLYRNNLYRLSMSKMSFSMLIEFLEIKEAEGGKVISLILNAHVAIIKVDRAALGGARGLQKLMDDKDGVEKDVPAEDEGIPGHNPGSANISQHSTGALNKLSLGPAHLDPDLVEDVKAELAQEDSAHPPGPGQSTLVEQFEQRIKTEPTDDAPPSREHIPFPPSTARDVAMEVQKVKENRDRFRIEGRTGGVGPGVSVTMFTFHNTFDSVNCVEFSGDNTLVAVGTAESYIRLWSLEDRALTSPQDPPGFQPSSSRRLIGHSGPVFAISFSPSVAIPEPPTNGHTESTISPDSKPRYMLSSSADTTIRLWSLDTWTNLVAYRSHSSPVWDVRFSPHGHYFVSASADRTARLWSTNQIAPLRLFVGHDSDVETVVWHPNGAYIFTAGGVGDKTVRMWAITGGNQVRIFTGHTGNITAISCSPNGGFVASADDKGVIILWDLRSGRLVKRMRGHGAGGVWSLDWSVESTVLVSGGADSSVRVWDVQQSKEAPKINGETGAKADGTVGTLNKAGKIKSREQATADMISDFKTKKSPVYKVRFTQMNLIMAGGAYLP